MFAMLMKETRPFVFVGLIATGLCASGIALSIPVLTEYVATGLVPRMPTWMQSLALVSLSAVALTAGLILDSVARGRNEMLRLAYLSQPQAASLQSPALAMAPKAFNETETRAA